jgi:hypothetical protein
MSVSSVERPVSALRQRMLEDMAMRGLRSDTQRNYISFVRDFAAFLGRAPDTATAEDVRRFQVHQRESGVQPPTINCSVSALRFFFTVTLDRPDLSRRLVPRTACRGVASGEARRSARTARLAAILSVLWRAHAHHRDVRALDAAARTAPRSHSNRDAVVTRHGKRSPHAAMPVVPATAIHAPFARTLTEGLNIASGKLRFHRPPGSKSRSPHPPRHHQRPDAAIIALDKKPKSP